MSPRAGLKLFRQTRSEARDIWFVAEFVHGLQYNLFLNAEVLINRKGAFENKRAINKIGLALAYSHRALTYSLSPGRLYSVSL